MTEKLAKSDPAKRVFDQRAWRARHRDHHIERPSNARNRCVTCSVEVQRGRLNCGHCGRQRARQ